MWQDVPSNEVLEELFQVFNLSRPQDFEGHSLSVSDVIANQTQWRVSGALCGQHRLQRFNRVSGQKAGTPFGSDESQRKVRCPRSAIPPSAGKRGMNMNFNHEEFMLMMLYNTGTRLGLIHESAAHAVLPDAR